MVKLCDILLAVGGFMLISQKLCVESRVGGANQLGGRKANGGTKTTGGKVMMEYIGATGAPVTFDGVPIEDGIDFHFLLGFAVDADPAGDPQNGTFSTYWADTLTPDAVASVKQSHPNVKVMASLSGWSVGGTTLRWYNPDPDTWISNAFSSLQSIIKTYNLDGVDIDYESFPKKGTNNFAYCIGELISRLKQESVISVATIAPYYLTVGPYIDLFNGYSGVIDYVNHQFYTDKVKTPGGYLEAYTLRAQQFDKGKLLPSYEVNGRGIQGDAFFDALSLLEENGFVINGVMIFSADASVSDGFYYEKKSQDFLLNTTRV